MLTIIKGILLIVLIIILVLLLMVLYLVISAFSYSIKCEFKDNTTAEFTLHDPLFIYKVSGGYNKKPFLKINVLFGIIKLFDLENKPPKKSKESKKEKKAPKDKKEASKDKKPKDENKPSAIDKLKKGYALYNDDENKEAVGIILKKIIWLLKKLLPKDKSFDLDFSLGTPDLTGELTAFISMFSFFYGGDMCIRPDFSFHDPYISGSARLSGKGRIVYVIIAAVSAMMNKSVMRLFKKLR